MTTAASPASTPTSSVDTVPSGWWRVLAGAPRPRKLPTGLDAAWEAMTGRIAVAIPRRGRYLRRAQRVLAHEATFADMDDATLREQALALRATFRRGRETVDDMHRAFAVVREVARRQLGLLAYPTQVAAALAMHDGCVAEVATGEGKTLIATLPATIAGWRGRGCHVITVNDYLARRDAQWMAGVYQFCGLTVAHLEADMPPDARRAAYAADITYATIKEVAADFLRDRLALGRRPNLTAALLAKMSTGGSAGPDRLVMRGLEHAIVDEADSVLIDEAVTPLILSGDAPNQEQIEAYTQADKLAQTLERDRHYRVNERYREVRLTDAGRRALAERCEAMGGLWAGTRRREELVSQALTAHVLFERDRHYVVKDDKIVIVDEFTGRLMPDRTWRDGLHQAVEAKEGLPVQPPKATFARVSFQRFFRMYRRLSGMTGTGWESRHEFWQVYRLPTVRIPTHRPCIRRHARDRVFATADAKWRAVVEEVRREHERGRPVLVGTNSVEASEHLSRLLTEAGLEHQVLNAVRHEEEAQIIARAGEARRITVATNMAGRGTDIKLGQGVAERGGLHVIATERHSARRVDRQLFGRAGRQGDPGSAVAFVSLDDQLIRQHDSRLLRHLPGTRRLRFLAAQHRAQRLARQQRKQVLRADDWSEQYLSFAGRE